MQQNENGPAIWPGHPHETKVLDYLKLLSASASLS